MITVDTYTNANEASRAFGSDSAIMGGGTLLMGALNYGRQNFTKIIRITDPVMKQIADAGDRIAIGAGVTMSEVIRSRDLAFLAPVAQSVGGPAIRNMATLGGNLFAGTPYGDFTVALLALDGIVKYANGSEQDLEGFLASRGNRKDVD